MAFTCCACTCAVLGCGSDGCPNDGAEPEVELDEAAVCNGRDNVGVADGARSRRGDGNLDLVGGGTGTVARSSVSPLAGPGVRLRYSSTSKMIVIRGCRGELGPTHPHDELFDCHGVAGGQRRLDHVHGFRPGDEPEDGPVLHIV